MAVLERGPNDLKGKVWSLGEASLIRPSKERDRKRKKARTPACRRTRSKDTQLQAAVSLLHGASPEPEEARHGGHRDGRGMLRAPALSSPAALHAAADEPRGCATLQVADPARACSASVISRDCQWRRSATTSRRRSVLRRSAEADLPRRCHSTGPSPDILRSPPQPNPSIQGNHRRGRLDRRINNGALRSERGLGRRGLHRGGRRKSVKFDLPPRPVKISGLGVKDAKMAIVSQAIDRAPCALFPRFNANLKQLLSLNRPIS